MEAIIITDLGKFRYALSTRFQCPVLVRQVGKWKTGIQSRPEFTWCSIPRGAQNRNPSRLAFNFEVESQLRRNCAETAPKLSPTWEQVRRN